MAQPLRIGNAQGFWGDSPDAPARLASQAADLDYLTLDYLAEVSMSILAKQRLRDPAAGYARDFVGVIRSLAPLWKSGRKFKLITNAGGLNPAQCARAVSEALAESDCDAMKIGIVSGDDVLPQLNASLAAADGHFAHLETARPLSGIGPRLITANAYIGAAPIVEALRAGADIVITGRVADPSLTVAPCIAHYDWALDDYTRIAGATLAGHLIECGTQVTGGISTDWLNLPDLPNLGYPIVEVFDDGSCIITKPPGSGGRVDLRIVKEQLVYEIGDPGKYLSPDVTASFLSLQLDQQSPDRVRVAGAAGTAPPPSYKVSATYRAGYRASGMLTIFGRNAAAKARQCGRIVLEHLRQINCEPRQFNVECLGAGGVAPGVIDDPAAADNLEVVLRLSAADEREPIVERFTREIAPLVTNGPQGTTGYAEGRPAVREVFGYWPTLIARHKVQPRVELISSPSLGTPETEKRKAEGERRNVLEHIVDVGSTCGKAATKTDGRLNPAPHGSANARTARLGDIAHARSGDKGAGANVGVIAFSPAAFDFLRGALTAEKVEAFFKPLGVRHVIRCQWPAIGALNFILPGILSGGGSLSLRIDAQGKTLGQVLLEMPLDVPAELLASIEG